MLRFDFAIHVAYGAEYGARENWTGAWIKIGKAYLGFDLTFGIVLTMKNRLLRFPLTLAALLLAVTVVTAALSGHVNVIQIPISVINRIARDEVDDIVTAFVLVVIALVVDNIRSAHRQARETKQKNEHQEAKRSEQLRVVHVTMRTVQDIVNNCLNQTQLLRLEAEGYVPEESLRVFDEAIEDTATKIKELGNLTVFAEKQMAIGSGLDLSDCSRLPQARVSSARTTADCRRRSHPTT